jgi:hypothetical protein
MVVLAKLNTCTYVKQKFSAGNRINRKKKKYQGAHTYVSIFTSKVQDNNHLKENDASILMQIRHCHKQVVSKKTYEYE